MTSSDEATPPPASVLYVDHASHPSPLSLCYHAASSRRLSSSIDEYDKSPPSTMTEIDSAYCPRCLSFYDAGSACSELGGRCPSSHCRSCPVCRSDLSVSVDAGSGGEEGGGSPICSYRCGYCRWSSEEISLTVSVDAGGGGGGGNDAAIEKAATKLAKDLDDRIATEGRAEEERFRSSADWWGKKAQEEERRRRQGDVAMGGGGRSSRRPFGEDDGPEGWSIETLEAAILAKKKEATTSELRAGAELPRLSLEDVDRASSEATATTTTAASSAPPDDALPLLPERIPLRSKKVRRCRAELAEGRTGILVKPKLNPLEGDSSLRSGQGKWWKKDSSAIHVVPRVKVVRRGSSSLDEEGSGSSGSPRRRRRIHALLLSVKNPTLGVVRLRFGGPSSSYASSLSSSSLDAAKIDESRGKGRAVLRNVLADAAKRIRVDAALILPTTTATGKGIVPTEMIELDAVEDAYLELGRGKKAGLPEEVEAWDPNTAASSAKDAEEENERTTSCSVRIVARREDEAWAELVVATTTADRGDDDGGDAKSRGESHLAAPISLQIEVGNGSWESSYVRPGNGDEKEGRDFVCLDLIVLWPKED